MTTYKIHSDGAYSLVFPDMKEISLKTPDRQSFFKAKNENKSMKGCWVELEGIVDGNKPLPDLSSVLPPHIVMSPKAYDFLKPHLSEYGEFLPVPLKGEVYQMFRCLNRIDRVDTVKSRFSEYDDPLELSFLPEDIEGQLIWATSYKMAAGLFCGDKFKELIEGSELTGLKINEDLISYS